MKWYWAILTYLIGLALGITLIIVTYKLLKDEEMKKHFDKSIHKVIDKESKRKETK